MKILFNHPNSNDAIKNIVVLIGACFMAGIIGAFAEYLSHNDESGSSAFKNKMKKLKEYMHYRHLPVQLQEEILYFHQHNWNKTHLLDERTVLSLLSLPLQLELSFEIFEDLTNLFPVLQECNTIVQKRLCHAFMRQTCIKNATIYSVGEIGWDIYFVTSGLVQVTLPSDEDDRLDEEGRANIPLIREKAMSLGLLYRPGNHFGESALVSHSGVRQETVTSHSVTELLFISKESLDEIFKLMPSRERNKLKSSLLSRNGNVWHRFDRIEENDHQTPVTEMSSSSFRSSSKSFLSWSKPDRFTMVQTQQSSRRLALHSRGSKRSRLRSFSADASVQAIRIGRSTNSFDTKKLVSSALNVRNRINMGTIKCAFGESEESEISKSSNVWDPGAT
jgi:CRP-like cAMP-binding protein